MLSFGLESDSVNINIISEFEIMNDENFNNLSRREISNISQDPQESSLVIQNTILGTQFRFQLCICFSFFLC